MKFSARLYTLFIAFLFSLSFLFLSPAKTLAAQAPTSNSVYNPFQPDYLDLVDEDKQLNQQTTGKNYPVSSRNTTDRKFVDILYSGSKLIICPEETICKQPDAISSVSRIMAMTYEYPPASAMAYTYDVLANAGLFPAKPAYAQGIGFAGLTPLIPLWKASRNIAYAVLIIVMLVIGFMIIFRMHIDPKTVISVQAALPRIVITLLMITFSYPIAGFFIDLMYLAIFILIKFLGDAVPADQLAFGAGFIKDVATQQQEFVQSGWGGWGKLVTSVFSLGLLPAFYGYFIGGITQIPGIIVGGGTSVGIGVILGKVITGLLSAPLLAKALLGAAVLSLVILFIIFLGLLFTLIRITFLLVNSYIQLLLAVIFGPLLLLKEAIPGQSAFKEWIQNIIANLVVFPATVGIIYLSWILTAVMWKGNLWGAPLIPVGGGAEGNPIAIFIGLGIIFLAPSLIAGVKKAFHAKPALPVTAGTAFSPITGAVGTGMGAMGQFYYMQQLLQERGILASLLSRFRIMKGSGDKP